MQAVQMFVFLAYALVLSGAHAEQSPDAACEYAARADAYVACDTREFVPQRDPADDIGEQDGLAKRVEPPAPWPQGETSDDSPWDRLPISEPRALA